MDSGAGRQELPPPIRNAVELILERKGVDVLALDLRGISSATDWFVIATGTSDIHVRAMADHLVDEMKKGDERPDHVEGRQSGRWVLIDYIDFVVHVFHRDTREFYQLENLWGDAPRHEIEGADADGGFNPSGPAE